MQVLSPAAPQGRIGRVGVGGRVPVELVKVRLARLAREDDGIVVTQLARIADEAERADDVRGGGAGDGRAHQLRVDVEVAGDHRFLGVETVGRRRRGGRGRAAQTTVRSRGGGRGGRGVDRPTLLLGKPQRIELAAGNFRRHHSDNQQSGDTTCQGLKGREIFAHLFCLPRQKQGHIRASGVKISSLRRKHWINRVFVRPPRISSRRRFLAREGRWTRALSSVLPHRQGNPVSPSILVWKTWLVRLLRRRPATFPGERRRRAAAWARRW